MDLESCIVSRITRMDGLRKQLLYVTAEEKNLTEELKGEI